MELLKNIGGIIIFPGFMFTVIMGLFLKGLDRKIIARMQRRKGPKLTIEFYDFAKLLGKDTIIPKNTSGKLFMLAPIVALVSICIIPIFIPIFSFVVNETVADIIVIVYLLLIPSIATIIGGMASGSPLASISIQKILISMISYELPLIISIVSICKKAGLILGEGITYSFISIIEAQKINGSFFLTLSLIPAAIAFIMILPAKIGVSSFNQGDTEIEILESTLVEYSGLYLGLFKIVHSSKVYVISGLFVSLFMGGLGVKLDNEIGALIINILIYIILIIFITTVSLSIVSGLMGSYKVGQTFKFYWTIPTVLATLSYILVSFNL